MTSVLAFDLGASSGRAVLGKLENGRLVIEEVVRFSNDPVQVGKRLHWDILRLYHELKQTLVKVKNMGVTPTSIAIDSWAVDFGLLGSTGELLVNPYHYRDHHTDGVMEEVFQLVSRDEIFARTGIQFLPFNTIYQLYTIKRANPALLENARHFLMIPDLLRYFLTGQRYNEFSNATTTQLYNPSVKDWDAHLLEKLEIPRHLFGEVVAPGSFVGVLQDSVCEELGVSQIPVIAVAEHDTGSAVAAVPAAEDDFVYLSCGTWSLMGIERSEALITQEAQAMNFTNEGGVDHTFRVLKNIMGLWILQECRREWEKAGQSFSFEQLVLLAEQVKPLQSFIEPDDLSFLNPLHMPLQIQQYCQQTGQKVPADIGLIVRCVLDSLALKYRYVLECTEELAGKHYTGLHMLGGGSNNRLLCQLTANAIGRPVWAGPTEASAIGNIVVQLIAAGHISGIREAREMIRNSFAIETYDPADQTDWNEAYVTFLQVTGLLRSTHSA